LQGADLLNNVDSDIDSILIVMDWAKRELETLSAQPPSTLPTIGRVLGGWAERVSSSRLAQSITMRMESMSESTFAN
jgi:hypothetical protein